MTYTCSDSPGTFCFVYESTVDTHVFKDKQTAFIQPGERVIECQTYDKAGIANRTVIKCCQWAYDFQGSLVAIGGFFALFQLTSRLSLSVSVECATFIIKQSPNLTCVIKSVRVILASLVAVIEYCLAIFYGASFIFEKDFIRLIHIYWNELLLIFRILTSVLWLPLEEYALSSVQSQDYHQDTTQTEEVGERLPLIQTHRSQVSSSVASRTHAITQTM